MVSGLGDALETTNSTATMIGAEEGNGDVAAMQGFRGPVERWGGRGGRGGASELVGGARGGRRRLLWRTAATVVFGRVRERARERRGEPGESEREQGERRGVVQGIERGGEGRQAGEQVAWRGGRARAPVTLPSLCRDEDDRGGRWAGPAAGWASQLAGPHSGGAQVSSSCYIFFCFLISDICFDLNNILNHLFNLCQFLQGLDILFQSSFIIGIIFGHILIYIINIFPMQIFMH